MKNLLNGYFSDVFVEPSVSVNFAQSSARDACPYVHVERCAISHEMSPLENSGLYRTFGMKARLVWFFPSRETLSPKVIFFPCMSIGMIVFLCLSSCGIIPHRRRSAMLSLRVTAWPSSQIRCGYGMPIKKQKKETV